VNNFIKRPNRKNLSAKDFPLLSTKANISEITLTGRYPEKGRAMNLKSEMIVYVLKGTVTFIKDGTKKKLTKGSVLLVPPKQPYFWVPNPRVTFLVFSTPAWTLKQHKNVE
jgi:mannose-6-phosphate isomerase-like protein (cupin superfamily)